MRRIGSREDMFVIEVDGQEILATPGETIASAILASGHKHLRASVRLHQPRSIFCSIGMCFECRVEVNGEPDVRACITEAAPGMVIRTYTFRDREGDVS